SDWVSFLVEDFCPQETRTKVIINTWSRMVISLKRFLPDEFTVLMIKKPEAQGNRKRQKNIKQADNYKHQQDNTCTGQQWYYCFIIFSRER
ncbi:MAG: hypothetical protein ABJA85_02990, partial [Bacteroidota bacterium]